MISLTLQLAKRNIAELRTVVLILVEKLGYCPDALKIIVITKLIKDNILSG